MKEEMTLQEAANELGITRQRLAVIAKSGRLGHQVVGRYWAFTREEIEAYRPHVQGRPGRPKEPAGTLEETRPA
jgi:excisionase family DNA binding protein